MTLETIRLCLTLAAAICTNDIAEPDKLFGTVYTPAEGGINCYLSCDTVGTGALVAPGYGRLAACPMPGLEPGDGWSKIPTYAKDENGRFIMNGDHLVIESWYTWAIEIDGHLWYCLDNFGAEDHRVPRWYYFDWFHGEDDGEHFWRVDFMDYGASDHYLNQAVITNWNRVWVPVPIEFWPHASRPLQAQVTW